MSRLFNETFEQQQRLDALNVSYICGTIVRNDQRMKSVALVDNVTKEVFHRGEHPESYSAALDIALKTVSNKPLTTAEIAAEALKLAAENAKLREMVEAAQAQTASSPKRKSQSTETT